MRRAKQEAPAALVWPRLPVNERGMIQGEPPQFVLHLAKPNKKPRLVGAGLL
jgi:hypothetical protein